MKKTISKLSSSLYCVLDSEMQRVDRINWTKAVDNIADTARTICNNSFTALKKFINTELAAPGGPTSMYAGAPTSFARRR